MLSAVQVSARIERFALAQPFTIARRAKTHVDVVSCEVAEGGQVGRGEGTPIYYRGETAEGCVAAIEAWAQAAHTDRERLQHEMPPGAARNALDCALWDLAARQQGEPVWRLAGLPPPRPVATAWTISLGDPATMARAAAEGVAAGFALLKLKLAGGPGDLARVGAVRGAARQARLIVDANESWAADRVAPTAEALATLGVELIEQPLPAGRDGSLGGPSLPVPLCADESCHVRADLAQLAGRYRAVNVKLDKAGGLTEALALARAARGEGLEIMLGCMLATSRAIRFALPLAPLARWIDLDAPALLAEDRSERLRYVKP